MPVTPDTPLPLLVRLVEVHLVLERTDPWLGFDHRRLVDLFGSWMADNLAEAYGPQWPPK